MRDRTIGEYLAALGSSSPAPGGGSVAGLVGALAAGLGQMVVSLTTKNEPNAVLGNASVRLQESMLRLLASAELDEEAYAGYVGAARLPKTTAKEKAERRAAMQAALVNAAEVPLATAMAATGVLDCLGPIAEEGTPHALSDAAIAVLLAEAAVHAALANVRVNIPLIKDAHTAQSLVGRADAIQSESMALANEVRGALARR